MNEYIKTAQELAKLPGTEKWPWRLEHIDQSDIGGPVETRTRLITWEEEDNTCHAIIAGDNWPWLRVDDFSPWSAAKWLVRAKAKVFWEEDASFNGDKGIWLLLLEGQIFIPLPSIEQGQEELAKNSGIKKIGQRAFGREVLIKSLEAEHNLSIRSRMFLRYLQNGNDYKAIKVYEQMKRTDERLVSKEHMAIIESNPSWNFTEEQRQPWLEAWNRGQDV